MLTTLVIVVATAIVCIANAAAETKIKTKEKECVITAGKSEFLKFYDYSPLCESMC